jgi:ubiquinol-cytochrome c reductase iron-sulfur subunit
MTPSERAKAIGAPVEVDIRNLAPGEKMVVKWRGKPVWILRRTPEMIASLSLEAVKGKLKDPDCKDSVQPAYVSSPARAIKDEYFVAIGICTHLGCSPSDKLKPGAAEGMVADWAGGFLCPCHGSIFDLAGRVFEKQPAPTNLEIPPYKYSDDGFFITIGEDSEIKGA